MHKMISEAFMERRMVYDAPLPPFDELVQLAEHDLEAFYQFKQKVCSEAIGYSSKEMQPRLNAQQSHLDRVIHLCKNPYHTNMVLAQELSAQLGKLQSVVNSRNIELDSAEIIPFNRIQKPEQKSQKHDS